MAKSGRNAVDQDWDVIRRVASDGYRDGIDTLACIEILEAGNNPSIVKAVRQAEAARACKLVMKSLFQRIHMSVMRAYDPIRDGDFHLAVAFKLLSKPAVVEMAPTPDNRSNLEEAAILWDEATNDRRLAILRHHRNKFVAHLSNPNPATPLPLYHELFGFARLTCRVWERLSFGAGTVLIELRHQVEPYRKSAEMFWPQWLK